MDSWDDSENDSRTICYDSDDVKNALENDYTDWESLLWQLQLQDEVKDVVQDILPEHFDFARYAINNMEISNLADIDDLCEILEQSVVDGDTDRIDWITEQDGGFWNYPLFKALEIDEGETYSHIANGELDDLEMLERALEAHTPEKDNEVLTLLMTVLENRQAVFSRACSTRNSGLFCIYLTGLQEDVLC